MPVSSSASSSSVLSSLDAFTTSGFRDAPVTKALVGGLAISQLALNVPVVSVVKRFLFCHIPQSLAKGEYWRIFTTKLVFVDLKDTIFCLILLYHFRVFERRYGSRKFASQLLGYFVLYTFIELALASCKSLTVAIADSGGQYPKDAAGFLAFLLSGSGNVQLATGPYGIILPLFVPFFCEVLDPDATLLMGLPLSIKTFYYVMGFNVVSSSYGTLIAGVSSIIAGLMYKFNFLYVKKWASMPKFLASICDRSLGWLVRSSPPKDDGTFIGATLEIQRVQREEAVEQEMLRHGARVMGVQNLLRGAGRRPAVGQGFAERLVGGQDAAWGALAGGGAFGQDRANLPAQREAIIEVSEANIAVLTDMGFSRQRVTEALRQTNNNVQLATAILIQDQN